MWSKITDPRISRSWHFENLYWMQVLLILNSTEAYYSDVCMGHRLQRRHDG